MQKAGAGACTCRCGWQGGRADGSRRAPPVPAPSSMHTGWARPLGHCCWLDRMPGAVRYWLSTMAPSQTLGTHQQRWGTAKWGGGGAVKGWRSRMHHPHCRARAGGAHVVPVRAGSDALSSPDARLPPAAALADGAWASRTCTPLCSSMTQSSAGACTLVSGTPRGRARHGASTPMHMCCDPSPNAAPAGDPPTKRSLYPM